MSPVVPLALVAVVALAFATKKKKKPPTEITGADLDLVQEELSRLPADLANLRDTALGSMNPASIRQAAETMRGRDFFATARLLEAAASLIEDLPPSVLSEIQTAIANGDWQRVHQIGLEVSSEHPHVGGFLMHYASERMRAMTS